MTKQTLVSKVDFINQDASHKEMQMFGFIKRDTTPYKLNIDNNLEKSIINIIAFGVKSNIAEADYSIVDLSTADNRKNRYYKYDLGNIPEGLKSMEDVIGNDDADFYDSNNHKISDLDHLIMVLSNGNDKVFSIYKQLSSVEKITKTTNSLLAKIGVGRDKIIEEDKPLFRIGPSFQAIWVDNNYIILNDKFLELNFKMLDILKNEAKANMRTIERTNLLLKPENLKKYMETTAFSRKLVRVMKNSLIIKNQVPKTDVISFIENDIELKKKLKIEEKEGEKFISITKKESAVIFLDLLNDEFVYSALTKQNYKASDKDLR